MYIDCHRLLGLRLFSLGYFLICKEKIHSSEQYQYETCSYFLRVSLYVNSYMKDILIQLKASGVTSYHFHSQGEYHLWLIWIQFQIVFFCSCWLNTLNFSPFYRVATLPSNSLISLLLCLSVKGEVIFW